MTRDVVISAVGARTPLGPDAESSWLALHGGVSGVREHAFMVDCKGDRIFGGADPGLSSELIGPDRFASLLELALSDLGRNFKQPQAKAPLPLLLAVPEERPGFAQREFNAVKTKVSGAHYTGLEVGEVYLRPHGHAGGVEAIGIAAHQVAQGDVDSNLFNKLSILNKFVKE